MGLILQVGLLPGGAIEASESKGQTQHTATSAQALIDTGASRTGISRQLVTQLTLQPHGKISLQGATGSTAVNTYHVDLVLRFSLQVIVVRNLNKAPYHVLIGRDIICEGVLTLDFDGHFTFCM